MKMSITVPVEQLLKIFKLKSEHDSHDDVWHDGYSSKSVLNMNLSLPDKYENLEKLCPSVIGRALEDCERNAHAEDMNKANIRALIDSLEKIDAGTAEYIDINNKSISEKAYIDSASFDSKEQTVTINFVNPHHLINGIISGVGYFAADIDTQSEPSQEDIISRLHHLPDFFKVWGGSISDPERYYSQSPDVSDESFADGISFELENMSDEEMAECVKDTLESERLTVEECFEVISKLDGFDSSKIKKSVIDLLSSEAEVAKDKIKHFKKMFKM